MKKTFITSMILIIMLIFIGNNLQKNINDSKFIDNIRLFSEDGGHNDQFEGRIIIIPLQEEGNDNPFSG